LAAVVEHLGKEEILTQHLAAVLETKTIRVAELAALEEVAMVTKAVAAVELVELAAMVLIAAVETEALVEVEPLVKEITVVLGSHTAPPMHMEEMAALV
jgi:hypothetical protein